METSYTLSAEFLGQVLAAASERGIVQEYFVIEPGIKPETLFQAKSRSNREFSAIKRFALSVGLKLVLQLI